MGCNCGIVGVRLECNENMIGVSGNYMDVFVSSNQKAIMMVGNLFAKAMSHKMYYVNQRQ